MGFAYIGAFIAQLSLGYVATRTTWTIFPYVLVAMAALLFISVEIVNFKTRNKNSVIK
ncbi:MAG: hypothetical protein BWX72_01749 [Firmicutes bacterium ADurb.Bin080]|nr:MAG: hypothetical protein BWX72_01749 [Firmicutes bacterium ADurb.Bin080]